MIVNCPNPECNLEYDDARRSTLCPHRKLMADSDMDRKIEALDLMDRAQGKLVKFRHMGASDGCRLLAVTWDGMVEVEGFAGQFAPHLFEVLEEATTMSSTDTPLSTTSYRNHPANRLTAELDNLFTYHAPKGDQQTRYLLLRSKAKELAAMIVDYCPPSADTTAAIRKLREAIQIANASIACGE